VLGEQVERAQLARRQLGGAARVQRGEELSAAESGAELVPALRELVGERLEITATDSCILQKLHSADCL